MTQKHISIIFNAAFQFSFKSFTTDQTKKKQKQAIPFAPNNDTPHQGRKRTKRLKRKIV